jgi:polyisoprenoid-binding protein YceI
VSDESVSAAHSSQHQRVTGVLVHDESDRTKSRVETTMEAASIETRESQRDTHLKSAASLAMHSSMAANA